MRSPWCSWWIQGWRRRCGFVCVGGGGVFGGWLLSALQLMNPGLEPQVFQGLGVGAVTCLGRLSSGTSRQGSCSAANFANRRAQQTLLSCACLPVPALLICCQADWAFAVRQVEESASFSTTLPELQLVDSSGRQLVARDVTLWRVDSLEDTPIGLAAMFQSWRYL